MPKFKKEADELETRFEKWLYLIKNLHLLNGIPTALEESVFHKVFKIAEVANFTRDEYMVYEGSLKQYRDLKSIINTAVDEAMKKGRKEGIEEGKKEGKEEGIKEGMKKGRKEGIEEGRKEGIEEGRKEERKNSIIALHKNGVPIESIAQSFGIGVEEVKRILGL